MAYKQDAVRRGGTTPQMTACRRNPKGWAEMCRIASSLVTCVLVWRVRRVPRSSRYSHLSPARPREI